MFHKFTGPVDTALAMSLWWISELSGHAQIGSPEIWNPDLQQVLLQVGQH